MCTLPRPQARPTSNHLLAAARTATCMSVWHRRHAVGDAEAPAASAGPYAKRGGASSGAPNQKREAMESKTSTSSVDGLLPPAAVLSSAVNPAEPDRPVPGLGLGQGALAAEPPAVSKRRRGGAHAHITPLSAEAAKAAPVL